MIDYIPSLRSYSEVLADLGQRAQQLRLARNWTQKDLANRTQLGVATIVRFERSGQISMENALRIATALGADEGFGRLFELPKFKSLDEVIAAKDRPRRQRARRRRIEDSAGS